MGGAWGSQGECGQRGCSGLGAGRGEPLLASPGSAPEAWRPRRTGLPPLPLSNRVSGEPGGEKEDRDSEAGLRGLSSDP